MNECNILANLKYFAHHNKKEILRYIPYDYENLENSKSNNLKKNI